MKILINRCYGGYGLSNAAYEWLIAHGVPVKRYVEPKRDPVTNRYNPEADDGKCIYDRSLTPRGESVFNDSYWRSVDSKNSGSIFGDRYWETWTRDDDARSDPLVVQCVEELGVRLASASLAELEIVEIPDDVEYVIEEYDGMEHVAERHRTW